MQSKAPTNKAKQWGVHLSLHPDDVYIFFMSNKKPQEPPNKSLNNSSKKDSKIGMVNYITLGGKVLETSLELASLVIQVIMQASAVL